MSIKPPSSFRKLRKVEQDGRKEALEGKGTCPGDKGVPTGAYNSTTAAEEFWMLPASPVGCLTLIL